MKAGTSRVCITPPVGTLMAGYAARTEPAVGVHDDLYVRALALSDGHMTVGLLVADICMVTADLVNDVRHRISTTTGVPPGHIVITATHTHAGPAGLSDLTARGGVFAAAVSFLGMLNPPLQESIKQAMVFAFEQAVGQMEDVGVGVSVAQAVGVGANRRRLDGPVDRDVVVLRFDTPAGKTKAIVFSQACHPTVLGPDNRLFSGDLVGLACRMLEVETDGLTAIGMTGAAGDISTRSTRRAATFAEAQRLAGILIDAVKSASTNVTIVDDSRLRLVNGLIELPRAEPPSVGELRVRLDAARRDLEDIRQNPKTSAYQLRQAQTAVEGITLQLETLKIGSLRDLLEVEVGVLQVGPAFLCTFPVELFVELGLHVRHAIGAEYTLIACYANDALGYLPAQSEYALGGYEVDMALLAAGSGERLVAYVLSLI